MGSQGWTGAVRSTFAAGRARAHGRAVTTPTTRSTTPNPNPPRPTRPTPKLNTRLPALTLASAWATLRAMAVMSAIPCSAAATVLAVGALTTRQPCWEREREGKGWLGAVGRGGGQGRGGGRAGGLPRSCVPLTAPRKHRRPTANKADLGRGAQVDVVHAHARPAHHLEAAGGGFKHFARDLRRRPDDQGVRHLHLFAQLLRRQAQGHVDRAELLQNLQA